MVKNSPKKTHPFQEKVNRANHQLKYFDQCRIRIFIHMDKYLYLRGTLPPKPDSRSTTPRQQIVALSGVEINEAGLQKAVEEAKFIELNLRRGTFDWSSYASKKTPTEKEIKNLAELVKVFEEDYRQRKGLKGANEYADRTWDKEYQRVYDRMLDFLGRTSPISVSSAKKFITETTTPNSRNRQRYVQRVAALFRLAGVKEKDLKPITSIKGNYSIRNLNPDSQEGRVRRIPSDEEIVKMRVKMKPGNPRWLFSVIATYGLRNHEVYLIDRDTLTADNSTGAIKIKPGGKSKRGRVVEPIYPEWYRRWKLWEGEPPPTIQTRNDRRGELVSKTFARYDVCRPYDLRHAYAVRNLFYPGRDDALVARQMGHSQTLHERIYEYWITEIREWNEVGKAIDERKTPPDDPAPEEDPWLKKPEKGQRPPKYVPESKGLTYEVALTKKFTKKPCPHCGSLRGSWKGWTWDKPTSGTNRLIYGKRLRCAACNKYQTIAPD